MAVRLSTERLGLLHEDQTEYAAMRLPSVARLTAIADIHPAPLAEPGQATDLHEEPIGGDDDTDEECDADIATDRSAMSDEEYYADALDSS